MLVYWEHMWVIILIVFVIFVFLWGRYHRQSILMCVFAPKKHSIGTENLVWAKSKTSKKPSIWNLLSSLFWFCLSKGQPLILDLLLLLMIMFLSDKDVWRGFDSIIFLCWVLGHQSTFINILVLLVELSWHLCLICNIITKTDRLFWLPFAMTSFIIWWYHQQAWYFLFEYLGENR